MSQLVVNNVLSYRNTNIVTSHFPPLMACARSRHLYQLSATSYINYGELRRCTELRFSLYYIVFYAPSDSVNTWKIPFKNHEYSSYHVPVQAHTSGKFVNQFDRSVK